MKRVLAIFLLSAFPVVASPPRQPVDPVKPVSVTLPIQDWQAVLSSVQDSARLSARDANRISQTIVNQVQAQLSPEK